MFSALQIYTTTKSISTLISSRVGLDGYGHYTPKNLRIFVALQITPIKYETIAYQITFSLAEPR